MAMFSGSKSGPSGGGSANLVEFKAGRCKLEPGSGPTKRKVVAEAAKGLVFVKQSNDSLVHFCWKDRDANRLVDDLIVFPGDTEFKEVSGCNDGQVFMLKFKSSDDRRLFWVQEPSIDKDIVKKVSDALNKPPPQRMSARGGSSERVISGANALASMPTSEELGALGGLDQSQLMQLLQFMDPSGTNNEGTLQNMISGASESNTSNVSQENALAQADAISSQLQRLLRSSGASSQRTEVDLADVTTGEKVTDTVKSNSESLLPHVPESSTPMQELIDTVHSPMFRQASSTFGHALQTGQMAPVLDQFGITEEAKKAAQNGDLLEFAKKLTEAEQNNAASKATASTSEDSVKEPEAKRGKPDDEMDLD